MTKREALRTLDPEDICPISLYSMSKWPLLCEERLTEMKFKFDLNLKMKLIIIDTAHFASSFPELKCIE